MKLLKNSLWSITGWVGSFIIGFISTPIFLKALGEEKYGLMILLYTIIAPLGLLDFGIGEATIKYVAEGLGQNDHQRVEKYLQSSMLVNLIIGLVGSVLILLLRNFIISFFNLSESDEHLAYAALSWISLTWFILQTQQTFTGSVVALQRYDLFNIYNFLYTLARVGVGLIILFSGGDLLNLISSQTVVLGIASLGWFLMTKILYRQTSLMPRFDRESFMKTLNFGSFQFMNRLGAVFTQQSQRFILGNLLSVKSVGFYSLAEQLNSIIYLITYHIGQVLFPAVSEMQGAKEEQKAGHITILTGWMISTIAISIFIPFFVFTKEILVFWLGYAISNEITDLSRILSIGAAIGCLFAIPSFYFLGTGRTKWLAIMSFLHGAFVILFSLILVPKMGLIGAGWAFTLGTIAHLMTLIVMWEKIFFIWISKENYYSSIFGPYIIGFFLICIFINLKNLFQDHLIAWPQLIILGVLLFILSAVLTVSIGVILPGGKERKELLIALTRKLKFL